MSYNKAAFDTNDLDLLLEVLSANPSMESAAHATKIIESELDFPIDHDQMSRIFRGRTQITVGHCTITPSHLRDYLPPESFPIESREELISRLIMAFERAHVQELSKLFGPRAASWERYGNGK